MKIVLANGCFDVLHAGHVRHLQEASLMGDRLIVALTTDQFVNKGRGRPINHWLDRSVVLEALRCVYMVIPTANAVNAIRMIKPAIFCKGIDYAGGDKWTEGVLEACLEVGALIRYTDTPKMSSSEIIEKAYPCGSL